MTLPAVTAEAFEAAGVDAETLAEVFVCSAASVASGDELAVEVAPAQGEKCPRCWNWRTLGADGLCCRCHEVIIELGKE